MSPIHDLISQIGDPRLCERLAAEWMAASTGKKFGLVFEYHLPELLPLHKVKPRHYEKLRLATAKPAEVSWHLPESIDFKRLPTDPQWDRHLYMESDGQFRTGLGTWEAGVLKEELAKPDVIGWLRNLPKKPWSLEIPYDTGGAIRPMFPDLVIVRKVGAGVTADILEPHDPSLGDNFEKAVGLARFAERHGALFGHIQLIRKQASPAGGGHYVRLEINQTATIKQLLLITSNPQLDDLFAKLGK